VRADRRTLRLEALATGVWLGLLQVALAFALMAGRGASVLLFFALTACWIGGGALGSLGAGRRSATALLVAALAVSALARWALGVAPFSGAALSAGLLAGGLGGAYAGSFLGERASAWGEARGLLLYENNGFVAGWIAATALLLLSTRALDTSTAVLGIVLLLARLRPIAGA
jgi:hypothetical protein